MWAGQADEVQVSAWSGHAVRDLRLHFVNTTGTATSLDRLRKTVRGVVAGAASAIRSLVGGDAQRPDRTARDRVARGLGRRRVPAARRRPSYGEVKLAFIHHTVSANDYGPEDSAAMVLGICRYHRNSNGWNDIGYNFLVDRYGTIFEGRAGGIAEAVVGAQAQGYNSQSTGIASIGTFSTAGQTRGGAARDRAPAGLEAGGARGAGSRAACRCVSGGGSTNRYPAGSRPSFERISGHRDGNAHRVPGRRPVRPAGAAARDGGPGPAARHHGDRRQRGAAQHPVRPEGRAPARPRRAPATPLAGKTVNVQLLGRLGWRTQHSVSTDAAGTAQTRVRMSSNRTAAGALRRGPGPAAVELAAGRDRRAAAGDGLGRRARVAPGRRGPGHRVRGAPQDARRADA